MVRFGVLGRKFVRFKTPQETGEMTRASTNVRTLYIQFHKPDPRFSACVIPPAVPLLIRAIQQMLG